MWGLGEEVDGEVEAVARGQLAHLAQRAVLGPAFIVGGVVARGGGEDGVGLLGGVFGGDDDVRALVVGLGDEQL